MKSEKNYNNLFKVSSIKSLFISGFFILTFPSLALATTTGAISVKLESAIRIGSIAELLLEILKIVITLATPIIVFFIIYAGFLYVTARGNVEQVKKASTALTYAVIGGVLIIGSVAIAGIIGDLVASF